MKVKSIKLIVGRYEGCCSVGSVTTIQSELMHENRHAIGKDVSNNRNGKGFQIILRLLPGSLNYRSPIREFTTHRHSNRSVHIVNSSVGVFDEQFGEHLFFTSQNYTIFASDSTSSFWIFYSFCCIFHLIDTSFWRECDDWQIVLIIRKSRLNSLIDLPCCHSFWIYSFFLYLIDISIVFIEI